VGDDVAQTRAREAALAEQRRGAARHPLADVRFSIFVAAGYDGDHIGAPGVTASAAAGACRTAHAGRRAGAVAPGVATGAAVARR
jgi:hypothetical protein